MKNDWAARVEAMTSRQAKDCLMFMVCLVNDGWEPETLKAHLEKLVREWGLDEYDLRETEDRFLRAGIRVVNGRYESAGNSEEI